MQATLQEMKDEAVRRMRELGLMEDVIKSFDENTDHVWVSENPLGALYWAWKGSGYTYEDIAVDLAEQIRGYGHLPYHGVMVQTEFGPILSMLFVSNEKEEWEDELSRNEDSFIAFAFCNTNGQGLDWGDIIVKPRIGGIIRKG